jgi:methionine-S-sulfoxide reductase
VPIFRSSIRLAAPAVLALALAASFAFAAKTPTAAPGLKPGSMKSVAASPTGAGSKIETAVFAMGCFWSAQSAFEGQPGVLSVVAGYTGGHVANPTYEQVSTRTTGHAESVQVTYDATRTSYARMLDVFWHNIDPTQADGQLYDIGDDYRTAIFYADASQRQLAEDSRRKIVASGMLKKPIATAIQAAMPFYSAEDYHQDYAKKNPADYWAYRNGSRRDQRMLEVWGALAGKPPVH